jgi:hypothetical protein
MTRSRARRGADLEDEVLEGGGDPEGVDPDVEQVLAELGGSAAMVQLHRQADRHPTRWDYLGRMDAGAFSLEAVKEEYGGGVYRARILDGAGRYVRHASFSIDPRVRPPSPAPPPAVPSPSDLGELRELLRQQTELLRQALTTQGDQALNTALRMVEVLKPAMAPQPGASAADMISLFREGLSLGRTLEVEPDPFLPLVEKVAVPLAGAITKMAEKEAQAMPTRVQLPNGAAAGAARTPAGWAGYVRRYLPHFLHRAARGLDAQLYADVLLAELPDGVRTALAEAAAAPDFVDQVLAAFPELRPHEAWFRELLEAVKDDLTGDDEDERGAPEAGEPGG